MRPFFKYAGVYMLGFLTPLAILLGLLLTEPPEDPLDFSLLESDPLCIEYNQASAQAARTLQTAFEAASYVPEDRDAPNFAVDLIDGNDWETLYQTNKNAAALFAEQDDDGACVMMSFRVEKIVYLSLQDTFMDSVNHALETKPQDHQPPNAFWQYYYSTRPSIDA